MKVFTTFRLFLAGSLLAALPVSANYLDLTPGGVDNSGFIGTGFFDASPKIGTVGTGNIDPFNRIQKNEQETGMNTNANGVYDNKAADFTRALQLSELITFNLDGTPGGSYYRFLLDINQNTGQDSEFLSLDQLKLGVGTGAAGNTGLATSFTDGITEVWNMQTGACLATIGGPASCKTSVDDGTPGADYNVAGKNGILLDYSNNNGSGNGRDMFFYVPTSTFGIATGSSYIYLYSQFGYLAAGVQNGRWSTNDGIEEWAIDKGSNSVVPEPGFYGVVSIGLVGLYAAVVRRRKQSEQA